VTIDAIASELPSYAARMSAARGAISEPITWYQFNILGNVTQMQRLLPDGYRNLDRLAEGLPVADIGAADGDLAFTLENAAGWEIDIIDTAAANQNGLRGAKLLREQLGSNVQIHDINLDEQFSLPRERYGLVFLLGILYHLQNPYFVLHELARRSHHCILSTKVARLAGKNRLDISDLPVGYLVGPTELNNDSTNYWILSPAGLERLTERAGWNTIATLNAGDTATSTPDSVEADERMFMLLRSRLPRG
jgi:tRNA (mo5U34)-methyltransferase